MLAIPLDDLPSTPMPSGKRSRSSSYATSDSESSPRKQQRSSSSTGSHDRRLKVHVVQAKLDPDEVARLYSLVETHRVDGLLDFELTPHPSDADVIVTAVRMRKRLERHVPWGLAKEKALVTPEWLTKSVEAGELLPCGKFAALRELHDHTVQHCPDDGDDGDSNTAASASPYTSAAATAQNSSGLTARDLRPPSHEPVTVDLDYRSRYACCRASPLVCPNQALVSRLAIVRRSRELEDDKISALSYDHAIGMIKSYPYEITEDRLDDISSLPHIGPKMISKIEEYLDTGDIEEAASIARSPRFQALEAFTDLYGVGATTARKLYAAGCRTLEDVERYYGVDGGEEDGDEEGNDEDEGDGGEGGGGEGETVEEAIADAYVPEGWGLQKDGNGKTRGHTHGASRRGAHPASGHNKHPTRKPRIPSITPRVALALRGDLAGRIPRGEVEEIRAVVARELEVVRPGCVTTIVGGYRRGKALSGDVDIVIGHSSLSPTGKQVKGLSALLVERLFEQGLVTHLMYLSGFHAPDVTRAAHWDALEKALTVFVLPGGVRRRVDLIFAAPEAYWTAVVGWTGSKTFERDLRRWAADQKGMKFDSTGLTRRSNGEVLIPKSEEDVFRMLGLNWVPPTLRNADA